VAQRLYSVANPPSPLFIPSNDAEKTKAVWEGVVAGSGGGEVGRLQRGGQRQRWNGTGWRLGR